MVVQYVNLADAVDYVRFPSDALVCRFARFGCKVEIFPRASTCTMLRDCQVKNFGPNEETDFKKMAETYWPDLARDWILEICEEYDMRYLESLS